MLRAKHLTPNYDRLCRSYQSELCTLFSPTNWLRQNNWWKFTGEVTWETNEDSAFDASYVDFSKAFDKVLHSLIKKVKSTRSKREWQEAKSVNIV